MIQRVMSEEGVPQDLIYLAVAESGFQPRAVNRKSRAGGMWQFMPRGNYGLARNNYVDERFDPEKSTRAYARYMKYIYAQLGDWYLSMAGYDWGTGNVQRAVQKTGYADFWELYKRNNLPGETKNYVPEILAAIIIANHPTQYGFDEIALDPPVLTDTVTINYSADLRLVSDIVGAPVDELIALNPSLLRMATPPDTEFDLHLPAGTASLFQEKIAAIPVSKRDSWRYHKVTPDDTLASVAHTYSVSASALADANQLETSSKLEGVEALLVPVPARAASSSHAVYYTTRRGDTLVSVADRFGISLSQLRRWNKLPNSGIRIDPGRRLHVAEPTLVRASTSRSRRGKGSHAHEASTEAANAIKVGRPRSTRRCHDPSGGCVDPLLRGCVVAIRAFPGDGRDRFTTVATHGLHPAASARQRRGWWWQQAATAAIAGPSDRRRSTDRPRGQTREETAGGPRRRAATAGATRREANGSRRHDDDWSARGVTFRSVLARPRQRRGRWWWKWIRHRFRNGSGSGPGFRWWIWWRRLPPRGRRRAPHAVETGDPEIHRECHA